MCISSMILCEDLSYFEFISYNSHFQHKMGNVQDLCMQTPPPNKLKESLCITMVNNMPIVRGSFNFNKQATFKKIEDGAVQFCISNDIDEGYSPLVSRVLAYKQTHLFDAFLHLPESARSRYLDALSAIDIQLMDSLYVHLVRNQQKLLPQNISKQLRGPAIVQTNNLTQNQREGLNEIGTEMLINGQVAIVFMCAGCSKRNNFQDKFLSPLSNNPKSTPLSLFFTRLKTYFTTANKSPKIPILIACSQINRNTVQQYVSEMDYFSFDPKFIKFITANSLPILDNEGKLCLNFECEVERRPQGTSVIIDEIAGKYIRGFLEYAGARYVQFIGMENLAEKPGDPLMLGLIRHMKMKLIAKCTESLDPYQNYSRYAETSQHFHLLATSELSQRNDPSLLMQAPIAMNCMIFDLQHLFKMLNEFQTQLYLSKRYRIGESLENYYDFTLKRPVINRKCYSFEKDIRDWIACPKKEQVALMKVGREQFLNVWNTAQVQSAWQRMGGQTMQIIGKVNR